MLKPDSLLKNQAEPLLNFQLRSGNLLDLGKMNLQLIANEEYEDRAQCGNNEAGGMKAHESNESERYEVYVRPFPGPGGKWQISTRGGDTPVWSKKAPELFYRSGEGMMMACTLSSLIWAPWFAPVAPEGKWLFIA
jgi:hypothetical protein